MGSEQSATTPPRHAVVVEADPLLGVLIDEILLQVGFDASHHRDLAAVAGAQPEANIAVFDLDNIPEDQELTVSMPVIFLTSAFLPSRQYPFRHVVVVKPFRVQDLRDAINELQAGSSS